MVPPVPRVMIAMGSKTCSSMMEASSTAISTYCRRWGSVMAVKVRNAPAPSTAAASSTSLFWACRPASRMSMANGVYCQVSTRMIVTIGTSVFQATGGRPTRPSPQLAMPVAASRMDHFHTRAAAAGMTRNGVIMRVRATPRPTKLRSSSTANRRPSSVERTTELPVTATVEPSEDRNEPSRSTLA
nr:hypothetical protein GCM10025730_49000 [Promicromonospora thailandica]